MKIEEILKPKIHLYCGYQLQSISYTKWSQAELKMFSQLKRIPPKITAFLRRAQISKVFKSTHAQKDIDNYYLVLAVDGTIFHCSY